MLPSILLSFRVSSYAFEYPLMLLSILLSFQILKLQSYIKRHTAPNLSTLFGIFRPDSLFKVAGQTLYGTFWLEVYCYDSAKTVSKHPLLARSSLSRISQNCIKTPTFGWKFAVLIQPKLHQNTHFWLKDRCYD